MKITSVDIIKAFKEPSIPAEVAVGNVPWHPVFVRINTDEGISGLGEVGVAYGNAQTAGFGGWGSFFIDEMQGNLDGNDLVRIDTQEVNVQDQWFISMRLEITQQDFLNLAIDFKVQDGRMEFFFLQRIIQFIMVHGDADGFGIATIDDTRCSASSAQAAARSGPYFCSSGCYDFH